MLAALVALALGVPPALDGTLDARLSQLEKRVAALTPGQLEGDHKLAKKELGQKLAAKAKSESVKKMGLSCVDTTSGFGNKLFDSKGDDCADYEGNTGWCGKYDDSDFDSNKMCCECGGGKLWGGKIWAANEDCEVCGLEWDGSMSGNERNAKFDCGGTADIVYIEAETQFQLAIAAGNANGESGFHPTVKIYAYVDDQKCGLEWDGSKSGSERNAKWDCSGSADPVTIENGKIYAVDSDGKKCGLEWSGSGGSERNAKWDCGGSADPLDIPIMLTERVDDGRPKYSDFSTCTPHDICCYKCEVHIGIGCLKFRQYTTKSNLGCDSGYDESC